MPMEDLREWGLTELAALLLRCRRREECWQTMAKKRLTLPERARSTPYGSEPSDSLLCTESPHDDICRPPALPACNWLRTASLARLRSERTPIPISSRYSRRRSRGHRFLLPVFSWPSLRNTQKPSRHRSHGRQSGSHTRWHLP